MTVLHKSGDLTVTGSLGVNSKTNLLNTSTVSGDSNLQSTIVVGSLTQQNGTPSLGNGGNVVLGDSLGSSTITV